MPDTLPEPDFQVISFHETKAGDSQAQARRYRKRSTHPKSRSGCFGCKVKRVKCDEEKPSCRRCHRSNTPCLYKPSQEPPLASSSSKATSQAQPARDLIFAPSAHSAAFPAHLNLGICSSSSPFGTPRIVLLHHFQTIFPEMQLLGSKGTNCVTSLGLLRPHLLDAMLAVSASHLRHHTPTDSADGVTLGHRVAEHFQQALAIRNFQSALTRPLDVQSSDALLLTSIMLNLLTFSSVRDSDPETSWVFSQDDDRLSWISLQMGLKPLLIATREYRETSILSWMFKSSDDEDRTFSSEGLPLTQVPPSWLSIFSLHSSSPSTNIFYEPIRILAELRTLTPGHETFFMYMSFFGKVDTELRDLLQKRDERAMWVLGYWIGLLCRFDFWWIKLRSWRDYRAIVMWLKKQGVWEREDDGGRLWMDLMGDLEEAPRWEGYDESPYK